MYAHGGRCHPGKKTRQWRKTGLRREEIGAFFISPCGAKVTSVRKPIGTDKTDVDGVFSLASVYSAIVDKVKKVHPLPLSKASMVGVGWANPVGKLQEHCSKTPFTWTAYRMS